MHGLSEEFLACAAFADNEDAGIAVCGNLCQLDLPQERLTFSFDVTELVLGVVAADFFGRISMTPCFSASVIIAPSAREDAFWMESTRQI